MSGTARSLDRRLWLLLALAALATAALYGSYRGVHHDAVPLRSASAPGVLAVDTAMDALTQAQTGAEKDAEQGVGENGDFHTRISVANQSLALAAADDVTGASGRQTLQTVAGLIANYSGWIEDASAQRADPALREAFLHYALSVLGDEYSTPRDATVMALLKQLRADQLAVVHRQSGFGGWLWLGWAAAAVLTVLLLGALAEAQHFARKRFRRRWNRPLLAAGALTVLAGGALGLFTWWTHAGMVRARAVLDRPQSGEGIPKAGSAVAARLAGTGFRASLTVWILVGGVVLLALIVRGLLPRINEYPRQDPILRRLASRTVVIGLSLALVAAVTVDVVRATAGGGSVTLLANWTGMQQDQFQRLVIDEFEHKYGIHVVYQGSAAESEVLAADVESGTPPDVAVLPGPGELAGYAGRGQLTPLDGLVRPADFGATWVTPVSGPGPAAGTPGPRHTYWVPIKADLKSMVWHPSALTRAQVAAYAARPGSWCMAMGGGATSGWPGTDWIEDILLQQSGAGVYQQWATGRLSWRDPRVRKAWTTWAALVGAGRPAVGHALRTDFGNAAVGVVADPPTCRLEHQSSFARGSTSWRKVGAGYVPSAAVIPGAVAGGDAWEVSGDLAAVLHDTPQARALISYLASDEAQRAWGSTDSGFPVDRRVLADAAVGNGTAAGIAAKLLDPTARRCYDASDAMPPVMRDAFELAVVQFLADPAVLDDRLAALDTIRSRSGATWLTSVCGTG